MQWIQDVHTYFCKRRVPCVNLFIMTIPSKSFCRIICMLENENIWELVFHSNHHEILLHLRIHVHERVMVHTVIIVSRDKYNIVSLIIMKSPSQIDSYIQRNKIIFENARCCFTFAPVMSHCARNSQSPLMYCPVLVNCSGNR